MAKQKQLRVSLYYAVLDTSCGFGDAGKLADSLAGAGRAVAGVDRVPGSAHDFVIRLKVDAGKEAEFERALAEIDPDKSWVYGKK